MEKYSKLEEILIPKVCKKCGGLFEYKGTGVYECRNCGNIIIDEFGRIKIFLEDNPKATMMIVSEGTGVPVNKIEKYLREGRLQIPENSDMFIKCEKCGTDIRYGRYCPECAAELSKKLDGVLKTYEVGEVPKKTAAKMRFLGDEDKNNRFRRDRS